MTTQEALKYAINKLDGDERYLANLIKMLPGMLEKDREENEHHIIQYKWQVEYGKAAIAALREKLAREQGCKECEWTACVGQEPCVVCLRGKVDCWQSNSPAPKGDAP